jgi:hypothetical protein
MKLIKTKLTNIFDLGLRGRRWSDVAMSARVSFKTKCATALLLGLCLHAQGAEEQNYFSHVTSSAFDSGDATGLPNFKGTLVKNAGESPVKDPYVMEVQAEKYSGFLRQRNLEIPNGLVNVSCRYKGKPGGSFEIKFVKNEKSALFKIESEGWQEGSKQLLFDPTVQSEGQLDLIFVPPKGGGTLQVGDIRIERAPVQVNTIQGAGYQGVGPYRLKERSTEIYALESEFQSKPQFVEVLLPDDFDKSKKYRVLYLLPVEAGQGVRFGDGIMVARKLEIQNQHDLIVVAPAFDSEPWYGNDAADPHRRQEDFLVKAVVPFIESQYPTTGTAEGRLLLGYSKSGWGALSLILRNPDVFGYAASWDAPLMFTEKQFGLWGTKETYGTPENMILYLPSKLVSERAGPFQNKKRLVVAGLKLFGTFTDAKFPYDGPSHTEAFHELAEANGVLHDYDPNIITGHSWNPVWMKPVVNMLIQLSETNKKP